MDLNLNALIDIGYLIPIAVTLRKVYAPSFELPEAMAKAVARLETTNPSPAARRRAGLQSAG